MGVGYFNLDLEAVEANLNEALCMTINQLVKDGLLNRNDAEEFVKNYSLIFKRRGIFSSLFDKNSVLDTDKKRYSMLLVKHTSGNFDANANEQD